jgi:hypothetical protein
MKLPSSIHPWALFVAGVFFCSMVPLVKDKVAFMLSIWGVGCLLGAFIRAAILSCNY